MQKKAKSVHVNIKTLAQMCGVSIGSVHRALHDRYGVSPKTKAKILEAAAVAGYRPNFAARSLATGRTKTIGIIVFDLAHEFFSQVITAIMARLSPEGCHAAIAISNRDAEEEKKCLEIMAGQNVEGIVLLSVHRGNEFDQYLKGIGRPIVTFGNLVSSRWPYIGVDYEKATSDAVFYAFSKGYRRIVFLCPPLKQNTRENTYALEARAAGYRKAVKQLTGVESYSLITGPDYLDAIDKLLSRGSEKTAILCSSDSYALKLLLHFNKHGVRVPTDVGLMGFDNLEILQYIQPSLATVDCSISEMGMRLAEFFLPGSGKKQMVHFIQHVIIPGGTL
jgi:LacI family transcriptional regulator